MLISVDLPAPFSPTMPVMAPLAMASDTPRTACTLPNDLWMPESSMAGTAAIPTTGVTGKHHSYIMSRSREQQVSRRRSNFCVPYGTKIRTCWQCKHRPGDRGLLAGVVAHVVVDGDLARDDVGLRRV